MTRDDLERMGAESDDGLGCEPFGHFASPFIDGELPETEMDRFRTNLPGSEACRRLMDEYRGIEAAARIPVPEVTAAQWDEAWDGVHRAIREDRERRLFGPLAPALRVAERMGRGRVPRALRPLVYLAASVLVVALLFAVRGAVESPDAGPVVVAELEDASDDLECQAPDYVPAVYMIADGDDAVNVMQCLYVGLVPAGKG